MLQGNKFFVLNIICEYMKAEKKVRTYTRKSKTGKTVVVKAHTAKYEAAKEKTKKGAGKEIEDLKGKKKTPIVEKSEPEIETPFTKEEFKEWHEGTGSDADKKVTKFLRRQLGPIGYQKFKKKAQNTKTPLRLFNSVISSGSASHSKDKPHKGTPYEVASATLKKSGLILHQLKNTPTAMEVYKAGDRKSLKNLIASVTYNGKAVSFGGHSEKENIKRYSSVILKALKEAGYSPKLTN